MATKYVWVQITIGGWMEVPAKTSPDAERRFAIDRFTKQCSKNNILASDQFALASEPVLEIPELRRHEAKLPLSVDLN